MNKQTMLRSTFRLFARKPRAAQKDAIESFSKIVDSHRTQKMEEFFQELATKFKPKIDKKTGNIDMNSMLDYMEKRYNEDPELKAQFDAIETKIGESAELQKLRTVWLRRIRTVLAEKYREKLKKSNMNT